MTPQVFEYVKNLNLKGATLDVGARDINGCVRELFDDYTGIDIVAGRNVDEVMCGHELEYGNETFDNVLCLEVLEHDPQFWLTIEEMQRVLKVGGVMVITAASIGFVKHEWPRDYWRFTTEGFRELLDGMWPLHVSENSRGTSVFGHGVKIE